MSVFGALQESLASAQFQICLLIFAVTVFLYIFGSKFKISLAAASMLCMFSLVLTGVTAPKEALGYIGNSTVLMVTGMMLIAGGFQRTQFCTKLALNIAKLAKGNMTAMMFGYCVLSMLLSQLIQSPLVAFGVCAPLMIATGEAMGIGPNKLMFPLGITAISTCCTLPIGAGATVATELNGYLESYGYTDYSFALADACFARLPVLILAVLYCAFIAPKLAPEECVLPSTYEKKDPAKVEVLPAFQEWAGVIIFFGSSLALMFDKKLGLAAWVITCTGGLLMVLLGVIRGKKAMDSMAINMSLVVAGALALAGALSATGVGDMVGGFVSNIALSVGGNSYVVGAIFFFFPFVLTQFMLNRGVMLIFHPIAIATCASMGADPRGLMILVQAACLTAFMTPMATGAVPFIMGYGGYDQKSMLKQGFPVAALFGVVSVLWTMTIFPLFH